MKTFPAKFSKHFDVICLRGTQTIKSPYRFFLFNTRQCLFTVMSRLVHGAMSKLHSFEVNDFETYINVTLVYLERHTEKMNIVFQQ